MNTVQISILALGSTGLAFSVILAVLSKKLKVEEDPRMAEVLAILPHINCGACGFHGCRAFAEAVVKESKIFNGCLPGGKEINDKIIKILGVSDEVSSKTKQVVVCRCGASWQEKKHSSTYSGPLTCIAAHQIGGVIDCVYGCLGLGDCVSVCPVKAIYMHEKKIYVDINKCIGCGNCVRICPRGLFEFSPFKDVIHYVACSNKEKALYVKSVCSKGCIGCGICVKVNESPFYLKDNLSYVDYKKALDDAPQEEAVSKCPTKCIFKINA